MKQTLLIERTPGQARLAVIEDGALCELYCQRPDSQNLSGNVYLGRVTNVLPGMNAAFVDIGMPKNGFLSASDIRLFAQGDRKLAEALGKRRIERLVRPGQELLVQAVRSEPGDKGPRLSSSVTLPGRRMVLLSGVDYVGVSRKIADSDERERLRAAGEALIGGTGNGLILRTAAMGADVGTLRAEYERLSALLADMRRRAEHAVSPRMIHDDNDLVLRAVRDMLNADVDALWADGADEYRRLTEVAGVLAPEYLDRIRLHDGQTPLFDLYRVDAQLDRAMEKRVWLKEGGALVIEETEAMTVVDVNTARHVGRRDAGETVFETNLEAARALMRQLRLRDIGGIVVVDFIDMRAPREREALLDELRACAARDRTTTTVVDMTPLGLVELTRKKARRSLSGQLMRACGRCGGNGVVPSHETTACRALRDVWRRRRGGDMTPLALEAHPAVCGWVKKLDPPKGDALAIQPCADLPEGEYRLAPADRQRSK